MRQPVTAFEGPGSFQNAKRLATYSHRPWIAWSDGQMSHARRATPEAIELALQHIGETGKAVLICGSTGTGLQGRAGMVRVWLANAKIGMLT